MLLYYMDTNNERQQFADFNKWMDVLPVSVNLVNARRQPIDVCVSLEEKDAMYRLTIDTAKYGQFVFELINAGGWNVFITIEMFMTLFYGHSPNGIDFAGDWRVFLPFINALLENGNTTLVNLFLSDETSHRLLLSFIGHFGVWKCISKASYIEFHKWMVNNHLERLVELIEDDSDDSDRRSQWSL